MTIITHTEQINHEQLQEENRFRYRGGLMYVYPVQENLLLFEAGVFAEHINDLTPDAVWRHKGSAPSVWEMQKELRRLRLEIKALAELVSGVFEMEDKNSRPGDGEVSDLKPQSLLTKEDKLL